MLSSVLLWLQCQRMAPLSGLECACAISVTAVAAGPQCAAAGKEIPG